VSSASVPARVFGFPESVNEVAARTVAAGVVALTSLYLVTGSGWVLVLLAYGFVARVLTGPTLSPLGQLATRVITPRLGLADRQVPGQPKQFAQGIGATLSLTAAAAHLMGFSVAALILTSMITIAAFGESALGFCLGCAIFARLIAAGVIPQAACEACNDISARLAADSTSCVFASQWPSSRSGRL